MQSRTRIRSSGGECADYLQEAADREGARRTLRAMVLNDRSEYVVFSAAWALWTVGEAEDAATLIEADTRRRLVRTAREHVRAGVYVLTGDIDYLLKLIRRWARQGERTVVAVDGFYKRTGVPADDADYVVQFLKELPAAGLALRRLDGFHQETGLAEHPRLPEVSTALGRAVLRYRDSEGRYIGDSMPELFRICLFKQ